VRPSDSTGFAARLRYAAEERNLGWVNAPLRDLSADDIKAFGRLMEIEHPATWLWVTDGDNVVETLRRAADLLEGRGSSS